MDEVSDKHFDSQSMGLRAQKKLLSKMASKKIAKIFIDETSGRLLDNLYGLAKEYSNNKKVSEKLLKNIIKIVIKVGILYRNEQFNEQEVLIAEKFKQKFRTVAMTIISFHEVDFTFDRNFLSELLGECETILLQLVQGHLTDKSRGRITSIFKFFGDVGFLEHVFRTGANTDILTKMVADLNVLLEKGML